MRSVVTGGAGFIGSHVTHRLRERGDDVLVIDNLSSGTSRLQFLESLGVRLETSDTRQERVVSLISDFAPDQICHLAAQIDVRRSVADPILDAKINVVGLLRVLEAARATNARVLFASSGGTIYGEVDPTDLPVPETLVGRPNSPYGITKRVAEDYLRVYRDLHEVDFVSLALGNVFGPRQDPHGEAGVVAIFGLRLLRGEQCTIFGDGKQTRDFIYVDDVADAFLAASTRGEGETINIATGKETSINQLLLMMSDISGGPAEPRFEPQRPGELNRISLDIGKAKRILEWSPKTDLAEGLMRTIDSLRAE